MERKVIVNLKFSLLFLLSANDVDSRILSLFCSIFSWKQTDLGLVKIGLLKLFKTRSN